MEKTTTPLPRIRLRQEETDAIVFMLCAVKRFQEAQQVMEKRISMIPNGKRNIRLIESTLDKLIDRLLDTIPLEKLGTLDLLMPDVRVNVTYTRRAGKSNEDVSGIATKDLDLLTAAAHDGVCKLCDGNCDRCDLGKVFDRFLNTDREKGESYTFMAMEKDFDIKGIRKGK